MKEILEELLKKGLKIELVPYKESLRVLCYKWKFPEDNLRDCGWILKSDVFCSNLTEALNQTLINVKVII